MKNLQTEQTKPRIFDRIIDGQKIQYITLLIDFEDEKQVPLTLAIPYVFDEEKIKQEKTKVTGIEISTASDMPDGVSFESPQKEIDELKELSEEEGVDNLKAELERIVGELSDDSQNVQEGSTETSEVQDKDD